MIAAGAIAALLVWVAAETFLSHSEVQQHDTSGATVDFVGSATCAQCHQTEARRWVGSHHDLAMQQASERSVLGDFENASVTHYGVTSHFYRRDGKLMVRTEGPDEQLHDYEIAYTFGVFPLQQYLIAFPGGRYQALGLAWDARAKDRGGQRWFHLYPNERIAPGNALHWTRLNQNWNFMCAECHSTNLRKNYDAATDRYATTWSEINVACEACHGAGARHVAWAKRRRDRRRLGSDAEADKGLAVLFDERRASAWSIDPASGSARRTDLPRRLRKEVEVCARCHARRSQLSEAWQPGRPLGDTHLVSLLERGLYHADGQMLDEVYNYGSFLQSKMYAKGVTCSDCHDPHTLKLRASGDGVCLQCHAAEKFSTPAHHGHEPAKASLSCASCHMPGQVFMVIDRRHDHSFRVPRPDLSAKSGSPNACTDCHADRAAAWAAAAIERWHGPTRKGSLDFGNAFALARRGAPEAGSLLLRIATDEGTPGIVRGTAWAELAPYLSPAMLPGIRRSHANVDPLIQIGALRTIEVVPLEQRWRLASPLLNDPVLAVRIQAASVLAPMRIEALAADDRARFERAAGEFIAAQRLNADRPDARTQLGIFFAQQRRFVEAEAEYRAAIRLDPRFVQAYVNLADLHREMKRDTEAEAALRAGLKIAPDTGALHHALGLALVRLGRLAEAVEELRRASELDPNHASFAYVYGVALRSAGKPDDAVSVLARNHERHPADREILRALVSYAVEDKDFTAALRYAERLAFLEPENRALAQLIEQLRAKPGRN